MPWKPKAKTAIDLEAKDIGELMTILNDRISKLETPEEAEKLEEAIRNRMRRVAAEVGITLKFCRLPGCGKPFLPCPQHQVFCTPEHKMTFHNKYGGQ